MNNSGMKKLFLENSYRLEGEDYMDFSGFMYALKEFSESPSQTQGVWTDEDMIEAYWAGLNGFIGAGHDTEEYNPTGGAEAWLTKFKEQKGIK